MSLIILSPIAVAQTAQEQLASRYRALDVIMDLRLERESVPGAAFGIVHDQDLIWSYQYGVESLKTKRPVTDDTAFSICSVSKLFNGVAAMALVERDQLELDKSIFDYLGDIAPADDTGSDEPATLRNLLSHVSGLPREGVEDFWADTRFPDSATLRASSQAHDQLYQPYEHWQYSNLGMALIGEAISEVTKQPWGSFIEQTILEPLGMENTTTDMPFDRVGKGFAHGYYIRDSKGRRKPVETHQFKAYAPAAGIASSVNDMAKFAAWNFRLRETGDREILNAATLKQMQRVHWVGPEFDDPAWGLAFATRRADGDTLWGHGGYCPGARTEFVMRLPDQTAYVMMLTANDVSPGAFVAIAYDFLNEKVVAAHGEDDDAAAESDGDAAKVAEPDDSIDLSEYEGHYATENYDWDSYIGLDDGALFSIAIYGANVVKNMEKLIHKEGDVFYRERDDGSEGERVIFERDKAGKIVSVTQHSYRAMKQ
ncbi:MAG: serine hydrolase [Woeseiaceae bacterium]